MSSKIGNSLGVAIGATLIGSLSLSQLAAASPAFQVGDLAAGYMLAAGAEGTCGEGKCGINLMDKNKDGKVTLEEAKATGIREAIFKAADANGDGVLDAAEVDAFTHKDKQGAAAAHGTSAKTGEAKAAEASCGGHKGGEGGCGAMNR